MSAVHPQSPAAAKLKSAVLGMEEAEEEGGGEE